MQTSATILSADISGSAELWPTPSEPIEAVVVDDEPLARLRLARLLAAEPDVRVTAECRNGEEAVRAIQELTPDVVFLDVRMPGLDGFQTLRNTRRVLPPLVFVTAFAEYAVDAFEVRALDYLLKPVDGPRVARSVSRVREERRIRRGPAREPHLAGVIQTLARGQSEIREALHGMGGRYPEQLMLRDGSKATLLHTESIEWIEADGNYVRIHSSDRAYLVRRSVSELEATLDPFRFARIHRSTIVNLGFVKSLSPAFAGAYFVHLKDGTELVLSRGYRDKLFDRVGTSL